MSKVIVIESDDEERNVTSLVGVMQINDVNKLEKQENTIASDGQNNITATTRRRPRKSVLMTKPNPDVQFETIALDSHSLSETSDDSNIIVNEATEQFCKRNPNIYAKKKKLVKSTVNTITELTNTAYEEFLGFSEVRDIISTIGEERARINYMLRSTGMPEIDFQLYTPPDTIQLQFEQRLKEINDST